MLTWSELAAERPDLTDGGRERFYQFGVGLAFLATIRKDGGPRVHPMCPMVGEQDGNLYAFIARGPKCNDLVRDGRYALNSFPPVNSEDHFYCAGRVEQRTDPDLYHRLDMQFWKERGKTEKPPESEGQLLFEFFVETAMLTRTTGIGDWHPNHHIWKFGT